MEISKFHFVIVFQICNYAAFVYIFICLAFGTELLRKNIYLQYFQELSVSKILTT